MYCVYDFRIIRTNTDRVKPPDETLKQGRNPDRGLLDSPSGKGCVSGSGLTPQEVQNAENSFKNPEKSGKRNRKSGNLYFYEILRFLRVLTIFFSLFVAFLYFSKVSKHGKLLYAPTLTIY